MTDLSVMTRRVYHFQSEEGPHDKIFVRDLVLSCFIGINPEEQGVAQKVSLTVEAQVAPTVRAHSDDIAQVCSYAMIADGIHRIAAEGHINLVETMAERIAAYCLQDSRLVSVRVRVEKLERGPGAVGVEIVRRPVSASTDAAPRSLRLFAISGDADQKDLDPIAIQKFAPST